MEDDRGKGKGAKYFEYLLERRDVSAGLFWCFIGDSDGEKFATRYERTLERVIRNMRRREVRLRKNLDDDYVDDDVEGD